MKNNQVHPFAAVILVLLIPFLCSTQSIIFNIPDDLCHTEAPQIGASFNLKLTFLDNNCINLFGQNPGTNAVLLSGGDNVFSQGAAVSELCTAKFSSVSASGGINSFNYGPNCGENNADDANVMINYGTNNISAPQESGGSTMFRLNIPQSDVLTVTNNNTIAGNYAQDYLKVVAGASNTATISIDNNTNQGQVFICIIRADGDKKTIAVLDPDPKTSSLTSFTVGETVYVVPVLKPKVQNNRGIEERIYEVGDPKLNGKIEVEEEAE